VCMQIKKHYYILLHYAKAKHEKSYTLQMGENCRRRKEEEEKKRQKFNRFSKLNSLIRISQSFYALLSLCVALCVCVCVYILCKQEAIFLFVSSAYLGLVTFQSINISELE
jgi:hypothetical protein